MRLGVRQYNTRGVFRPRVKQHIRPADVSNNGNLMLDILQKRDIIIREVRGLLVVCIGRRDNPVFHRSAFTYQTSNWDKPVGHRQLAAQPFALTIIHQDAVG
jgi:hypothetical protein